MKRTILWLSGISWLHDSGEYFPPVTYPGIVSGSSFQQAIIEGIESLDYSVDILCDCDMSSGSKIEWSHNGYSKDIRIAGKRNKYLRIISKIIGYGREIRKNPNVLNHDYFCAYEVHLPYLIALRKIKRKKPDAKTIIICPDLSIYMDLNKKSGFKHFLKKIENRIVKKLLKYIDGYILFTEQMNDYFGSYNKPYEVIEGVYKEKFQFGNTSKKNFILYAGSLHYNTGIEEIIEAFNKINNRDVELWICGTGAMEKYIKNASLKNNKIIFKGFVNPDELFKYEQEAQLLLNLRNPIEIYTKYSFPSKMFEFMASGTPVMCTDLAGIGPEYKRNCIIIENNDVDLIVKSINKYFEMNIVDRLSIGNDARNFILNYKNKYIQAEKLKKLLERI